MPPGIQWRIALSYIALLTLIMVGLGVSLIGYLRQQQLRGLETQLTQEAQIVATAAVDRLRFAGPDSLDPLAKQLGRDTGLRVTLIGVDGRVWGDSEADPATTENHADRPEVREALDGRVGEVQRYSATVERDLLYLAVPMRDAGSTVGIARVALPVTQLQASVNAVAAAVGAALIMAALLALALAVIIARAIAMPIQALTDSARRLAQGLPHRPLPVNAGGEVGELAAAFNDMAERVRDHLRGVEQQRARLAAVLANIPDGVIILNDEGLIVLMNGTAAELLSVEREAAEGKSLIQVTRDHELSDLGLDAVQRSTGVTSRLMERGTGERRRSLQAVAAPLPSEASSTAAALVVLQDVTELRRTELVRRDFVANVSHELRTPIASIKAMVETLEEGALEDADAARDFLARIHVEVDGLTRLIEELMELSRIESGRVQLHLEPRDVRPALRSAAQRLHAPAERQGVMLESLLGDEPLIAAVDDDRLQQMIMNLLHNAIKATEPGGTVRLVASQRGREIQIAVSDTGIGIARDELGRLFERFYKVDKSRSSGGTGLGLAIAKHLTQAHGGRIWAESPGPGKGATFTVALPSCDRQHSAA